jgi:hypothetical protein
MRRALEALAAQLPAPIRLIVGGGGAMILAHRFQLATTDIDAVPVGMSPHELDPAVKAVASKLGLAPDWLNPYYSTFTHVLPQDYGTRLVGVLSAPNLEVLALSKDDLLIMKCFAGRQKDVAHARELIRAGARVAFVEAHLERLKRLRIPKAEAALDFLDEVVDLTGGR